MCFSLSRADISLGFFGGFKEELFGWMAVPEVPDWTPVGVEEFSYDGIFPDKPPLVGCKLLPALL